MILYFHLNWGDLKIIFKNLFLGIDRKDFLVYNNIEVTKPTKIVLIEVTKPTKIVLIEVTKPTKIVLMVAFSDATIIFRKEKDAALDCNT